MNISKRQNGELNAIITIEVKPEDYQPKVDKTINEYRKSANIPGFRPGHVPSGIIKKKYGKEVLIDELNRMLGEELINYLRDNNINVLGSPIPMQTSDLSSLEEGRNFSFDYEIGIAPSVNVKYPETEIPYFQIIVDDKMIDDDINDMRRRYGKFSNPESADETSILYGEFNELDENGEIKADGNKTTTTLAIESIKDEDQKNKFIGLKKDEFVDFNPVNAIKNETEVSAMLRVEKNSPSLNSDYRFTIKTVNKIEKAELNQEFYDKIFGEGIVNSEEDFRVKIREGIERHFEKDSDKKLQKDIRTVLLSENIFSLPDDFLKRFLKSKQEKPKEDHDFEHEYFHLAEDLKWNLIQDTIAADQSFSVSKEDVFETGRIIISQQYLQYGAPVPEKDILDKIVKDYLEKDDNYDRLDRAILNQKVFDYLKMNLKQEVIKLPYAEFFEKFKENSEHEHH